MPVRVAHTTQAKTYILAQVHFLPRQNKHPENTLNWRKNFLNWHKMPKISTGSKKIAPSDIPAPRRFVYLA